MKVVPGFTKTRPQMVVKKIPWKHKEEEQEDNEEEKPKNVTMPSRVVYSWRGGERSVCPCRLYATRSTHRVVCKDGVCVTVPAPGRFGCEMRIEWEGCK